MAITKERKEALVAEYVELLGRSRAVFLTEYSGLSVKQLEALRGDVRKSEGALHVTKNTLLRYALEQTGQPAPGDLLAGQLAAAFALAEAPSLAKLLVEFAKGDERFKIRAAIIGEQVLSAEQVEALAKLPSLDELRAQIIGLISAPAQHIALALAGGVRQVVNVLDAYARSEAEAAPAG
ncbi:MAG: 50S ribosomal protein L10 [Candidatus Promineifilaceae bacterium]